jgi:ABC-type transport system involved in cytochrome bd biosynthesis fused ATPase/permease subunit
MGVVARVLAEPAAYAGGARAVPPLPASIAFERVTFRYEGAESDALRGVDFVWGPGHVLALVGANGSGKSTCLRLLLSLARPRGGQILIGREPLHETDADSWRAGVAFLAQRPYLPPRSNVREAVCFLVPEATDAKIHEALDRVGLLTSMGSAVRDPLAVRVDTLSVGQRQRVALARLLCQDARLVLLDEPDANLDRAGTAMVAAVIRDLARTSMVALAAHSADLLEVADRVVLLDDGRVVRDDANVRLAAT